MTPPAPCSRSRGGSDESSSFPTSRDHSKLQAEIFSLDDYNYGSITKVFRDVQEKWKDARIKSAIWNTAQWYARLSTLRLPLAKVPAVEQGSSAGRTSLSWISARTTSSVQ